MFRVTNTPMHLLPRLVRKEDGATAVEYGLMVALIAIVIIVAVTLLGGNLEQMVGDAGCAMDGDNTAATDVYLNGACT